MREIEVLVELKTDLQTALSKMTKFENKGKKQVIDTYFYDPKRENLKLNADNKLMECCRVREKNNVYTITYKKDHYKEGIWQYSDEFETAVSDEIEMRRILECLGLQELVTINNIKYTYETPDYEIVIEDVKDLGSFLEVECINDDGKQSVEAVKKQIYAFIAGLGLDVGNELNSGKPELLLLKRQM